MDDGTIHCHVSNVSRKRPDGTERSVVAKAAYNAGVSLRSDRVGRVFSFKSRDDVVASYLFAPDHAPKWCHDRSTLWNTVERCAKRKDARLAKSIEASFSREIADAERVALIKRFVTPFLDGGIVVDVSIHEDGTNHNPHVHFLLTTQEITTDGFGKKLGFIDSKKFLHGIRERWAEETNTALAASGSASVVDHRSYKKRGDGRVPGQHRGIDFKERTFRRERAHQVREGLDMTASNEEQEKYPLLTQREVWPPASPYPDTAMSDRERKELKAYFEDRQTQDVQENKEDRGERTLPDDSSEPVEKHFLDEQPKQTSPWYEQALDRAKRDEVVEAVPAGRQASMDYKQDVVWQDDRDVRQTKERQDLVSRAGMMERNRSEHQLVESVKHEPEHVRDGVKAMLLEARIDRLKRTDEQKRLAAFERTLQPSVREKLKSALAQIREEEPERSEAYPVPDPDRNPISPYEQETAQREMLEEYDREEER